MRRGFVFVASGLFFCILSNINAAVTVYVVPAISDDKILPESVLPEALISRNIALTACRGEFEPASFVVRSDTDITGLCLTSSDLILEDGTGIIPADYVDIRVVKCWYQAGYRVNDLIHKHLTPELIVKDDSLIYTSDESNYLKLTPNVGDPYYVCISDPDTKDYRQVLSLEEFPVKDTVTLQPVNLVSGQNKQFWITVKVPEDAAFGTYTGHITLTTSDIVETIDVKIWVPEFTLLPPCLTYSIYYRGVLDPIGSISSERKNVTQFTAEMRNLFNHGVTAPTLYGQSYLRDALAIRKNEHIDNSTLYYLGYGIATPGLASLWPDFIETITPYGVDQVYIYGFDEQDHDTPQRRAQIAAVHTLGGKVFVAQNPARASAVVDILDMAVSSTLDSSLAQLYHDYGHQVFSYGNPQVGEENPARYRRNYGLLLWRNNYDGTMNYAYQDSFGNIWNDFDHYRYRDHNFTYPTVTGVIDTLAWEGFREGVDDVRYLTTLHARIEEVIQSSDAELKRIAKNAKAWLSGYLPGSGLDVVRTKVIQYILKLHGLPDGSAVLDTDLRGKWSFDEPGRSLYVYDESSCENVGMLCNADVDSAWGAGKIGGGLSLNKGTTGQYVECGNAESLNISDEITVMAWVRSTEINSQVIYACGQNGPRFRINVNQNQTMNVWVRTENEGWHDSGSGAVRDWTGWHHIAWTYHSATNTMKLYFDGMEDFSSTTVSTGPLTSEPLQFVRIGGGENNCYFHGDLDEVKIYARALTGGEIMSEITKEFKRYDLRGEWSFSVPFEVSPMLDSSGNGNHGTPVNVDEYAMRVSGKVGGGVSLNGGGTTGQYIDCGNAESLNISEEITVTAWVKPTAPQSQVIYIRGQNGSRVRLGVNPMISLWVNTENEGWHNGGEGNTHDWTGWHHIAWTYHRATNTTKFYFDGVEDFCSTTISTGPLTSEPLQYVRIGGGENNRYFHGDLDEVRIYAKALSSDAIKAIFNGTDLPPDDRLAGDANGDGKVDVGDLGILAANYGGAGKTWSQGDFNGDGVVDVGDLGILAANYGTATNNADFHSDYMQVFGPYATDIDSDVEDNNIPCSGVGFFLIVGALFFYWLKPENLDRFGV